MIAAHSQRLQSADFPLHALGAFAIALVDHENVGDLHDAGLDGLHIVAHARHQNDNRDIGQAHDVDFVLSNSDRLDHHQVASRGIKHGRHIRRGARQSAQRTARGHAANVDSGIGKMLLHADAVAQNRSAGVGTGGIDRDDADGAFFLAIVAGQLIDQRALARARRTGESKYPRTARCAGRGP